MSTFKYFEDECEKLAARLFDHAAELYERRLQEARFHTMSCRAVPCDARGAEVRYDDDDWSHVRLRVKSLHLEEYHMLDGEREPVIQRLSASKYRDKVEKFTLHIGEEEFDLTNDNWEVVFAKTAVELPARGFVSLTYTSTIFGRWFVELQQVPVGLDLRRQTCMACSLM